MRTPVPDAPPGEFTVHVDPITGGSGQYEAATGMLTFDRQSHNALGGPGEATTGQLPAVKAFAGDSSAQSSCLRKELESTVDFGDGHPA